MPSVGKEQKTRGGRNATLIKVPKLRGQKVSTLGKTPTNINKSKSADHTAAGKKMLTEVEADKHHAPGQIDTQTCTSSTKSTHNIEISNTAKTGGTDYEDKESIKCETKPSPEVAKETTKASEEHGTNSSQNNGPTEGDVGTIEKDRDTLKQDERVKTHVIEKQSINDAERRRSTEGNNAEYNEDTLKLVEKSQVTEKGGINDAEQRQSTKEDTDEKGTENVAQDMERDGIPVEQRKQTQKETLNRSSNKDGKSSVINNYDAITEVSNEEYEYEENRGDPGDDVYADDVTDNFSEASIRIEDDKFECGFCRSAAVVGRCDQCIEFICQKCLNRHRRTTVTGSHGVFLFKCEESKKIGKVVPATGFCQMCSIYLCDKCVVLHSGFKKFRNHFIVKGTEMPVLWPKPAPVKPKRAPTRVPVRSNLSRGPKSRSMSRLSNFSIINPMYQREPKLMWSERKGYFFKWFQY